MKSDLAERLLQALMDWDVPRFAHEVARMQTLASLKYDGYGGYRAGVKFAENLARWLEQFDPNERETAFNFVMDNLIFMSDVEIEHLINVAYKDHLELLFLRRSAADTSMSRYRVNAIYADPNFHSLRRRTLFLGLSDGARLDKLRRASQLSHEQFIQDYMVADELAESAQDALRKALSSQSLPGEPTFRYVILVDDFSGSGKTLVREGSEPGALIGKLPRAKERLDHLLVKGLLADDYQVCLLLYAASQQAVEHVKALLPEVELADLQLEVIQVISRNYRVDVTSPEMAALCREYYDPESADQHKNDTPIGYDDCALPLVLAHNTPNNSVCLLWSETPQALDRRGLFPRYERHHRDRP